MYRLARGLFVDLRPDGPRVWVPSRRALIPLDVDSLALATRFGDGSSIDDAAEAAGLEADAALHEVVEALATGGVLEPADAPVASIAPGEPVQARVAAVADRLATRHAAGGVFAADATFDDRDVVFVGFDPALQAGASPSLDVMIGALEDALARARPVVYMLDNLDMGGAPASELAGPRGMGALYATMARLSGRVPQIAVVTRTLSRPMSFLPALTDVVIMSEGARVHLGDPAAVREFTGREIDGDELGGVTLHATRTGLCDVRCETPADALVAARAAIRWLLRTPLPAQAPAEPLVEVPDDLSTAFSMRAFVRGIVDGGELLELKAQFAPELATMFARLDGRVIGIIANDSDQLGGIITADAARKASRFLSLCDAHGIPFVALADTPGFQIGPVSERRAIVAEGARLFTTLAEAAVPHVTVVVRKAHTAGLYAMGGPGFAPHAVLALPAASIGILGERAVIAGAGALEKALDEHDRDRLRGYMRAARPDPRALVDEVVAADQLRAALVTRFAAMQPSRRQHAVYPL
ncbi:MAG: hypothetical protein JO257_10815 [Deltaproteobacteria bacterium]|nr:hypothetical protein [Deltaproteobacteria bacterium]